MIEIRSLTKSFGPFRALDDVHLTLPDGQWGVLYGPNGAGKTTLIRILATLMRPSEGTVRVMGLEATKEPEAIRRKVGLLGHQLYLYEDLTASENLAFTASLYGVGHQSERIDRVLKQVELTDWRDATVRILSHGMKKRLALARVMLIEPQLLLLDEPYAGLDARSREMLTSHLVFFKEGGGTILLSTHFPQAMAAAPVDRLFVLGQGRIEQDEVFPERVDWAGALERIAPRGWAS